MRAFQLYLSVFVNSYFSGGTTSRDNETQYFIKSPSNFSANCTEGSEVFGTFECSTRSGDAPLWIINTSAVDKIRNSSGYASTHYEYFALQGEGWILSFLSIPASRQTNNSMVICAAIGDGEAVAFSDPVYLIVFLKDNENHSTNISASATPPRSTHFSTTLPTGSNETVFSRQSVELIAGLTVIACLVTGLAILLSFTGAIFVLQRRQKSKEKKEICHVVEDNIYWTREDQTLPPLPDTEEDLKKQNKSL